MFEGSEKKIEIIFSPKSLSLFEKPQKFWKNIVRSCGADIISSAQFPKIHSHILSESSLFIWSHRLVLITCGKTALSKSLIKILNSFPEESIELCFFQRKNEFFPKEQKSCFQKDIQKITKKISGKAYRFGPLHDRHFFLFHNSSDFIPEKEDQTLEVLIYDSKYYKDSSQKTMLHLKKELEKAFFGFEMQEHFFKPLGYSLNAVREDLYYTVHISPEESAFYISFETNIKEKSIPYLTEKVLNIFQPGKFDFILFKPCEQKKEDFTSKDYFPSSAFYETLDCGYDIIYKNFYKFHTHKQKPVLITES